MAQRRKRRSKAEIAAEKEEKAVELNFGSSYEKEIDEIIEGKVASEQAPAPSAPTPPSPVAAPDPKPKLVTGYDDPMFGLTQTLFGRGRREWRRRTRRGLD